MRLSVKKFLVLILAIPLMAGPLAAARAAEPALSHPSEAKKIHYTCPMHPQVVADKPGNCPICGMRLVPLEEAESGVDDSPMGEGAQRVAVTISPEKQQLIGVTFGTAAVMPLSKIVRAPARVAYDPELYEAQIAYLREARAAEGTLRNRELAYRNLVDSRWEAPRVDQAKAKLVNLGMDEASIQALVKGAKADARLLGVSPDHEVWLYAEVVDQDARLVRKGDRVLLDVPGLSGKPVESMVAVIGEAVDPATRTVRVWCLAKDPDGLLKPGLWVNAEIHADLGQALAVPEEAVIFTGTETLVFIDRGEGRFEPRDAALGPHADGFYAVTDGLKAGERVVTSGNFLIDSESRMKAALAMTLHKHGSAS